MAIVKNTASEIGDQILIQATSPIFGVVNLTSFVDETEDETGSRYFKKEFAYSVDGIFYSEWIELTDSNLQQIIVSPTDAFYINYKYTRIGADPSGTIAFKKICLTGEFIEPICENYFILPNSIFKDFFCANPQHSLLCSVLTNKMFEKGILPEYIIRNRTDNPKVDDKDFLDFWGTVCCFFALILVLGKRLENFDSFEESLKDFLEQRDIIFCKSLEELQDLKFLKSNYYDEIRQRGTWNIFEPKGFENKPINGEFLRLVCKGECDEFIWELITDEKCGWWLGKSSPAYKGTSFSRQLVKNKEVSPDFLDLNSYEIFNTNGGKVDLINDSGKNVVVIRQVPDGQVCGFASNQNTQTPNLSKAITIDENVDYEITFWVKQDKIVNNISFGVEGWDCNENSVFPRKINTGALNKFFFTKKKLNKANTWYFVRGILYNKNQKLLSENKSYLNIGFGNNLKSFTGMSKILPYLVLDRTDNPDSTAKLYIWDFKIRPLVKGAISNKIYNDLSGIPDKDNRVSFGSFATGFLTTKNLLHVTYKDNNQELSRREIEEIARHKLIPYNSTLITTELTPLPPPTGLELLEFDYLIVRYIWFESSGKDLDTRTCIEGTFDNTVDEKYVGWARGNIYPSGGRRYIGAVGSPYLLWCGDNTTVFGEEQVLVDFKKVAEDFTNTVDLYARLRAFWYGTKNTGEIEFEFETFLGGTMEPDGLGFKNVGGVPVNKVTKKATVNLTRTMVSGSASNIDGEDLGRIKYNKLTKRAVFLTA